MRTPQRNYYEVLGVPRTATPEEIKRRYRKLVRTYHPDVRQDASASAHQFFVEIVDAYKTLGDPLRRAEYDRLLEATARSAAAGSRPGNATTQRPGGAPSSQAAGAGGPTAGGTTRQQTRTAPDIGRLISEAEMSFIRGNLKDAESLAQQAVRLDRRNARAYAILGDVHRTQGQIDQAITDYTYAIQFDPGNAELQRRLDRLVNKERYRSTDSASPEISGEKEASLTMVINGIGWSVVAMLAFLTFTAQPNKDNPLPTLSFPPVDQWTYKFLGLAIATGILAGFLLASGRFIRPLDDELIFSSIGHTHAVALPIGLLLVVSALLCFYLALAIFIVTSVIQEYFSRSLSIVFGIALVLTLVLALAYTTGTQQVLLFGGNLVFVCMLVGWFLGDFFRGRW